MFTSALINILQHTDSLRTAKAIDWMLRKTTAGPDFSAAEWYERNGFYRIASGLGGSTSYAGQRVSRETALGCTALYAGTKIIAEDMGASPFNLWRKSQDGKRIEKANDLPLFTALHDIWNPEVSSGEAVEALTAHALLTGNAYALKQPTSSAVGSYYLWPWQPEDVRTDRSPNGTIFYVHKEGNSASKTYSRDQVFHLKGFTLTGEAGDDLVRRARNMIGITQAAEEFAGRYFSQDAAPGLVIKFPATAKKLTLESVEELKKKWKEWHQGVARSHEPAVLQEGADVDRLVPDAEKTQLLQTRRNQVIEVCRLLRLPPHKLADLERATFSNIEHQGIEYVSQTLLPWISRWKRAVYRCLLTFDEQRAGLLYAEHDVAALLRGDFSTQAESFRKLLEKGVYSINEVRQWLGLNPVEGGDEHFIQLNMATVQDVAAGIVQPLSGAAKSIASPMRRADLIGELKAMIAAAEAEPENVLRMPLQRTN